MDIGRIAAVYRAFAVQPEKGLDLAHHLAAGSPGLEHCQRKHSKVSRKLKTRLRLLGPAVSAASSGCGRKSRRCCWSSW